MNDICGIIDGPINVEAISHRAEGLVAEARELAKINPKKIVVKIPMTLEGMKAVKELSIEGIKTNVTLVFSPVQALLAAKAGATYVSPFIGRLDDISHIGMDLVEQIMTIFDNYKIPTEVIVASIRHPVHILDAAFNRRAYLDHSVQDLGTTSQTPLDRHRHREVPQGLGKGAEIGKRPERENTMNERLTIPGAFFDSKKDKTLPALSARASGKAIVIKRGEFEEKVKRLALGLVSLGIKPFETVAILSENSPEWIISDLAISGRARDKRARLHDPRTRRKTIHTTRLEVRRSHFSTHFVRARLRGKRDSIASRLDRD